jgi:hypothetical protein
MVKVPGNVVILEDENELLEKMMMKKKNQKAVKKYTPCTSTHMQHTYCTKQTHVVEKEGKKVVRTVHHQLTHAHPYMH